MTKKKARPSPDILPGLVIVDADLVILPISKKTRRAIQATNQSVQVAPAPQGMFVRDGIGGYFLHNS